MYQYFDGESAVRKMNEQVICIDNAKSVQVIQLIESVALCLG